MSITRKVTRRQGIFVLITVLVVLLLISTRKGKRRMKRVRSDVDGQMYLVQHKEDPLESQRAANMLGRIKRRIHTVARHLDANITSYPTMRPYIEQLNRNLKRTVFQETDNTGKLTSYSVNKGDKIVFCLRSKKGDEKLHSLNLVTYVALHEIGHVGCPEYGHTPLFNKIFAFFAAEAIKLDEYKRVPFERTPKEYCGMMIHSSVV